MGGTQFLSIVVVCGSVIETSFREVVRGAVRPASGVDQSAAGPSVRRCAAARASHCVALS
ncbi:hypothetical protein GCM10022231_07900 [Gordonia caeni]|uniref:Uncharacterized protein n=1 Tax=Gordonia caeni TaxID=1007097 RepID=A0ABP7NTM6_9ACTN